MKVNIREFRNRLKYYLSLPSVHITSRGRVIAQTQCVHDDTEKIVSVHKQTSKRGVHKQSGVHKKKPDFIQYYGCGCKKKDGVLLCPIHERL